jgi:GNAT superfamily N-acetyltransferase
MEIREVQGRRDRDRFIKFPWKIYRGDSNWVPPLIIERRAFLDPKQNPFFDHSDVRLFLASDSAGNDVGRIAAIVNHNHIKTHSENAGFFGLFESVNDQGVANRLFEAAAGFLRSSGMQIMRGPENMSINDDLGLLVKGFDLPPTLMMPYNPRYYETLIERYGFSKAMDLYAYLGITDGTIPERLERAVEIGQKRYRYAIRPIDMKKFDREVKWIRQLYNQAWERNWNAIAMTDREFDHLAKDLKMIIDPGLCLLAEVEGKPAGFSLALPDLNQALIHLNGRLFPLGIFTLLYFKRRITRTRVLTMGVLPEYRRMGIDMALIHGTYRRAHEKNWLQSELSWVLETNGAMNNALIRFGFENQKTYRVYDRPL